MHIIILRIIIHEPGKGTYTIFLCLWCPPMMYGANTLLNLYILINQDSFISASAVTIGADYNMLVGRYK